MHEETFEQIHLPKDVVENADLMKEGQHVEMMFLVDEERCLTCELPTYVTLKVTYTGAKIMVPLFINQDDVITVNTTDRSYGQRV